MIRMYLNRVALFSIIPVEETVTQNRIYSRFPGKEIKHMKTRIYNLLFLIFIFSCSVDYPITPTNPLPTPSNSTLVSATQTFFPSPTKTLNPTQSPTETENIPTSTVDLLDGLHGYKKQCIPIIDGSFTQERYPGILLNRVWQRYQLFNLFDHKTTLLQIEKKLVNQIYDVSPNRSKFIASSVDLQDLLIIDAFGILIKKVKYQDQWKIIRWLDNDKWLIQLREPGNAFVVYDPNTEEIISSFAIDIPDAFSISSPPGQDLTIALIDPSATLAIYFEHNNGGRAILWDIHRQNIIGWLPIYVPATQDEEDYSDSHLPSLLEEWSPDGSRFALAAPVNYMNSKNPATITEELFLIYRSGNIEQISHFNDIFPYVHVESPEWSPDGIRLAFWLQTNQFYQDKITGKYRLVIFDTNTKLFMDYCLGLFDWGDYVIWSPNGNYMIIESVSDETLIRTTYVVDFDKGKAAKIKYDPIIENWLIDQ
ncbi:MAG: PD40 domain-containing protein [Anaerolineales bacterium]|nr:PD40 domain-containing protein [Anaerolineales bacterium]